jgi:hypothetical protein
MISLNSLLWKIIYDDPLTMVYRPCYPWYFNPSPTHGVSTPYPLYLDLPTHGISTPHPWYFDSLPMVYRPPTDGISSTLPMVHIYRPPYPWYSDPLPMVHRPPYPWHFYPPTNGISNPWYFDPLPISWLEMRGSIYHGGSKYHMTPVLSSFMNYHRICNQINTTSTTSEAGTAYLSRAPKFSPGF